MYKIIVTNMLEYIYFLNCTCIVADLHEVSVFGNYEIWESGKEILKFSNLWHIDT
jgi:hypothetical protein